MKSISVVLANMIGNTIRKNERRSGELLIESIPVFSAMQLQPSTSVKEYQHLYMDRLTKWQIHRTYDKSHSASKGICSLVCLLRAVTLKNIHHSDHHLSFPTRSSVGCSTTPLGLINVTVSPADWWSTSRQVVFNVCHERLYFCHTIESLFQQNDFICLLSLHLKR